jgi:hypothetical protein
MGISPGRVSIGGWIAFLVDFPCRPEKEKDPFKKKKKEKKKIKKYIR